MSSRSNSDVADANLPGVLAVGHALCLIVFLSWRFGGMEPVSRQFAGCAVAAAPVLTILAWLRADALLRRRFLGFALPLAALVVLVLISATNPNMRILTSEGTAEALAPREDFVRFLPSSVWPAQMLPDFFLNAGLVLVGLNLFLARPTRGQQRLLLGVVAVNAAILACVGSIFKLGHATQILGLFASPNQNFFATFFYYNHWGGFALLGAAAAAALALHYRDRAPHGEWSQTPAPVLGVLALLLLVSLPLSGARASMAAGMLLAIILAVRLVPHSSAGRARHRLRVVSVLAVCTLLSAATLWVARDRLQFLSRKTSSQISELHSGGIGEGRLQLYKEAWRLFRDRPVFGWGWHSFRYAFRRVQVYEFRMQNEQRAKTVVLDAHNDWLQLLTEMGVVGAALALGTVIGIGRIAAAKRWRLSPTYELAAGAVAVALLACVDFPFACPAVVVTWWALVATAGSIALDRSRTPLPT
jgi:O-antigen ligase